MPLGVGHRAFGPSRGDTLQPAKRAHRLIGPLLLMSRRTPLRIERTPPYRERHQPGAPRIFEHRDERGLRVRAGCSFQMRIRHGDASARTKHRHPASQERAGIGEMDPRRLSPEDIGIVNVGIRHERVLASKFDAFVQPDAACQIDGVVVPSGILLDAYDTTAKRIGQYACGTAQSSADVHDRARAIHAGERRELQRRLDAAGMILVGDVRQRVDRQMPLGHAIVANTLRRDARENRPLIQRVIAVDFVEFHGCARSMSITKDEEQNP